MVMVCMCVLTDGDGVYVCAHCGDGVYVCAHCGDGVYVCAH